MYGRGYPGFAPYAGHAHNGHPFLWLLFLVVLVIVVGFVAAFVFRWLAGRRTGWLRPVAVAGAPSEALDIVRLRYARGEIDREQFLQASADLGGQAAWPATEPSAPDASTAAS
ncbi:MAG TPA: SHOCT domain-containing protein [Gaiellaceae bacterium]|jgi:putative membrane protein